MTTIIIIIIIFAPATITSIRPWAEIFQRSFRRQVTDATGGAGAVAFFPGGGPRRPLKWHRRVVC